MFAPKSNNRRISLLVLWVVLMAVIANHLSVKSTPNGPLLVIDEREIDLLGEMNIRWTAMITDCSPVSTLEPKDALYQQALKAVQDYSPPQSQKAHLVGVWQQDSWLLVEAQFDELLPSVVPLKSTGGDLSIVPQAVWSGYTAPWKATPFIRQYINKQAPELPSALINCFKPTTLGFR